MDIHPYIYSSHGMISFPSEYIKHLKDSYGGRSYLGKPEYIYANIVMPYFGLTKEIKKIQEKNKEILYSKCCKYGQIKIPPYKEPPPFLSMLINNKESTISKHFLQKIR
jgi:hypothetical protein